MRVCLLDVTNPKGKSLVFGAEAVLIKPDRRNPCTCNRWGVLRYNSAAETPMFTFPQLPDRPNEETRTTTLVLVDDGDITLDSQSFIYTVNLDIPGNPPLAYYNPTYGSPLVFADNWPHFTTHLINNGTIWTYSDLSSETALRVINLTNTGDIISEINIPLSEPGITGFRQPMASYLLAGLWTPILQIQVGLWQLAAAPAQWRS